MFDKYLCHVNGLRSRCNVDISDGIKSYEHCFFFFNKMSHSEKNLAHFCLNYCDTSAKFGINVAWDLQFRKVLQPPISHHLAIQNSICLPFEKTDIFFDFELLHLVWWVKPSQVCIFLIIQYFDRVIKFDVIFWDIDQIESKSVNWNVLQINKNAFIDHHDLYFDVKNVIYLLFFLKSHLLPVSVTNKSPVGDCVDQWDVLLWAELSTTEHALPPPPLNK